MFVSENPAIERDRQKFLIVRRDQERLQIVDRMLNVVHQRGDLAAMFIQGGTATLNKIMSQGGYTTEFDSFEDRVRQQRAY